MRVGAIVLIVESSLLDTNVTLVARAVEYDCEEDIPETDEEDMPPLEGMGDSGDEGDGLAPPQPPAAVPPGRRGVPPAQARRNNAAPPAKNTQPPVATNKKAAQDQHAGGDFFGFGSSLTVKGKLLESFLIRLRTSGIGRTRPNAQIDFWPFRHSYSC